MKSAKFVDKTSQPNHYGKFGEPKGSRVKLTSIGELFQFEINIMKLFGGVMLDERFNWYLGVAYKLFVAALSAFFIRGTYLVYDRMTVDTKSARQYIKFFWTLHFATGTLAFFNNCFSSIRNKRLISVLLSKRLDGRYFEHSLNSPDVAPRGAHPSLPDDSEEEASAVDSLRGWLEKQDEAADGMQVPAGHKKGARQGPDWRVVSVQLRREVGANLSRIRRDFGEGARNIFGHISRVRLARLLIIVSVLLSAITATLRADYKLHSGTSSLTAKSATTLTMPQIVVARADGLAALSPDEARPTSNDRSGSDFGGTLHEAMRQMTAPVRRLVGRLMQSARLAPTFLWKLLLVLSIFSLIHGQPALTLFITAALSDALRRARQAQLALIESKLRMRPDGRWCDREERALAHEHRLRLEMTQLLIQVLDMSLQMAYFSMLILFVATNQLHWLTLLSIDYVAMIIIALCARIGYIWLHAEVRKIGSIYERRIIASALETHDLIERSPGREPLLLSDPSLASSSASLAASSGPAASQPGSASNWPLRWRPRALQADEIKLKQNRTAAISGKAAREASYLARIEATTNFRLAQEIAQLWPTDWFHPDLQSYVSQNFFVITFVATLQQLVEAGAKLQVQAHRTGVGLAGNKSAAASAIN